MTGYRYEQSRPLGREKKDTMRPTFITNEQIIRWGEALEKDELTPSFFKEADLLREIMFAGFWLLEELVLLGCEQHIIGQLQFTHGAMSYGNDTWKIADELLAAYKKGELTFIDEEGVSQEIEKAKKLDIPRDPKTQN